MRRLRAWLALTFADFRINSGAVLQAVSAPNVSLNSDEADLFSTGIHVLSSTHRCCARSRFRIAQYSDFLTQCSTAPGRYSNRLATSPDVGHSTGKRSAPGTAGVWPSITAPLNDETQRVANVNAQRADTLKNVPVVVEHATAHVGDGRGCSQPPACARQYSQSRTGMPVSESLAVPPELQARSWRCVARGAGELAAP